MNPLRAVSFVYEALFTLSEFTLPSLAPLPTAADLSNQRIGQNIFLVGGGGGGSALISVGRVTIFSNKILGGSLFFNLKLEEGHNFISQSRRTLISGLVTILQLAGPSA